MASPPQGLRAEERGPPFGPPRVERLECALEFGRLHVIGVGPEARVLDPLVGGRGPPAAPASTQVLEPSVLDPAPSERGRKGLPGEPGMTSRGWEPPDVGELLDPVTLEERQEVRQLVG